MIILLDILREIESNLYLLAKSLLKKANVQSQIFALSICKSAPTKTEIDIKPTTFSTLPNIIVNKQAMITRLNTSVDEAAITNFSTLCKYAIVTPEQAANGTAKVKSLLNLHARPTIQDLCSCQENKVYSLKKSDIKNQIKIKIDAIISIIF